MNKLSRIKIMRFNQSMMQKGFTLIELMIVAAIIGILSAVAIPAYQDYTKRAHVTEGLVLSGGAKAGVTEYYSSEGSWPTTNGAAGVAASISGNAVISVLVGPSGVITITYNNKVADKGTLTLTPTASAGAITWACAQGNTDMLKRYLPANCR